MTSIRAARAALLVFLALFAGGIGVVIWRAGGADRPSPAPRPVPDAPAQVPVEPLEEVASAARTFQFTEERGGVVVTRLQAGRMLGMEGGSRILGEILIEFRPQPEDHPERLARVEGEAGRFDAESHEVVLRDRVVIQLASGERLECTTLRYELGSRIARTEDEVHFFLDATRGTARGLTAHLQDETLELHHDVVLRGQDGDGAASEVRAAGLSHDGATESTLLRGPVSLTGSWGRFDGGDLALREEPSSGTRAVSDQPGAVDLSQEGEPSWRLAAASWVFLLTPDRRVKAVEAGGGARLTPTPGTRAVQLPLAELTAPRVRIEPGGEAPRLEARSGPDGAVVALLEPGSPLTRVEAESLDLITDRSAGQALFQGRVRGTAPGRSAAGDSLLARKDGSALLQGRAEAPARVQDDRRSLQAIAIELAPGGDAGARGDVRIDLDAGPDGERLIAAGERADYDAARELLRLEGQVRVRQGSDILEAAWMELDRRADVLTAGGGVVTTLGSARQDDDAVRASQRAEVRARHLVWERGRQQAAYSGGVDMRQGEARLQASRVELETGTAGQRAFSASGDVRFQDPEWKGAGERLTYDPESSLYHLESSTGEAVVTSFREGGGMLRGAHLSVNPEDGRALVQGLPGGRVEIRSGAVPPESGL